MNKIRYYKEYEDGSIADFQYNLDDEEGLLKLYRSMNAFGKFDIWQFMEIYARVNPRWRDDSRGRKIVNGRMYEIEDYEKLQEDNKVIQLKAPYHELGGR